MRWQRFISVLLLSWMLIPDASAQSTQSAQSAQSKQIVLVLPFAPGNAGASKADWLGLGAAHYISAALKANPKAVIVARGSQLEVLMALGKNKHDSLDRKAAARVGQLVGADAVVVGQYSVVAKEVKLEMDLLRGGEHKSYAFVGEIGEPFALYDDMVDELAQQLSLGNVADKQGPPRSVKAHIPYTYCLENLALIVERAAIKLRKIKPKVKTVRSCEMAAAAAPDNVMVQAAVLSAYALRGAVPSRKKLAQFLSQNPQSEIAALALISVLHRFGTEEETDTIYHLAKQAQPQNLSLMRLRAEIFFDVDDHERGGAIYQEALQLSPKNPYFHYRLSVAWYFERRGPEAVAHAKKASELSSGTVAVYENNLGERLIDNREYQAAEQVLRTVVWDLAPDWAKPKIRLSYVYLNLNRPDDALELLDAASKVKMSREDKIDRLPELIGLNKVSAYALKGDVEKATKLLKKLKKMKMIEKIDLKVNERFYTKIKDDPNFAECVAGL